MTILFMLPFALIGLLTFVCWLRPSKHPMDKSNRINRIMLWWLVINKPHLFVGDWAIFTMDVEDQVKAIGEAKDE